MGWILEALGEWMMGEPLIGGEGIQLWPLADAPTCHCSARAPLSLDT
jgi:hypothetical protein